MYKKMKAIPDLAHIIDFAEYAVLVVLSTGNSTSDAPVEYPKKLEHLKQSEASMKNCFYRNPNFPKEKATTPEL